MPGLEWTVISDKDLLSADDACIVLLGRIARTQPELAEDALDALRDIDSPRAAALVAAIVRETGRPA